MDIKAGFVSLIGRPNVGKSTIINMLVGEKISITSEKPQTTRQNIRGIYNDESTQIVFVDTPGIQIPRNKLSEYMLSQSKSASSDVDIIVIVVDGEHSDNSLKTKFADNLKQNAQAKFLVINKIDKISNEEILNQIDFYSKLNLFDEIIPLSALKGTNKTELLNTIKSYLNYSYKFYPDNMVTDRSNYNLISEIIREKLLRYLDKEVPHGIAVQIEKITDDKEKNIIHISATIFCEKESHKKIIIGKDGKKIKGIGKAARKELEKIYGCKIYLETWVKVKTNWRNNSRLIQNMGFDLNNL